MHFRFPLSPPASLLELFGRVRDLLPQLERKTFTNVQIGTVTTAVAHGCRSIPRIVGNPIPHCLAMVCQDQPPDAQNVYLRASNECVVDFEVIE
jgi:hypothetical protein